MALLIGVVLRNLGQSILGFLLDSNWQRDGFQLRKNTDYTLTGPRAGHL